MNFLTSLFQTPTFSNQQKSIARSMILVNDAADDSAYYLCEIEYRKAPTVQKAQKIYDMFLKSDAPHKINIETSSTQEVVSINNNITNNNITVNLFDRFNKIGFQYYLGQSPSAQNSVNKSLNDNGKRARNSYIIDAQNVATQIFWGGNLFPNTCMFLWQLK